MKIDKAAMFEQWNELSLAMSGGYLAIDDEESVFLRVWIRKNADKLDGGFTSFVQSVEDLEDRMMGADSKSKFLKEMDKLLTEYKK